MSRYEQLETFLLHQTAGEVPMTFSQIEQLIGRALPASARKYRPWWSNNAANSVITRAWLEAGYKTERVDMAGEKLVFRKADRPRTPSRAPAGNSLERIYGAMRGTVRLLPGVDLTSPTDEHWAAETD